MDIGALGLLLNERPLTRLYAYEVVLVYCFALTTDSLERARERARTRRLLGRLLRRMPWSSASTLISARIIALLFDEARILTHRSSSNELVSVVKLNLFTTIEFEPGGFSNKTSESLRVLNRRSSARYCSISLLVSARYFTRILLTNCARRSTVSVSRLKLVAMYLTSSPLSARPFLSLINSMYESSTKGTTIAAA